MVVLGAGLTIVTANNLSADVGFVREQRSRPFVRKYEHGKYVPVLATADLIRRRVDDHERVLAPLAPVMSYVSGRQVVSQREILGRTYLANYPQALLEARLHYAVFPASAYRVKEPFVARLMERNIIFPIKKIGWADGWYLARVRVRVPNVTDWRELPKGWTPDRPRRRRARQAMPTTSSTSAAATQPAVTPVSR
jgi:hypothetical protein